MIWFPNHPYSLPINLHKPMEFKYWYNFQKMLSLSKPEGYRYDQELAPYSAVITSNSLKFKTDVARTYFLLRFS